MNENTILALAIISYLVIAWIAAEIRANKWQEHAKELQKQIYLSENDRRIQIMAIENLVKPKEPQQP